MTQNVPGLVRLAGLSAFIAVTALLVAIAVPTLAEAAERGGPSPFEAEPTPAPAPVPTETAIPTEATPPVGPAGRARLVNGLAVAPANAPLAVRQVIAAANRISTRPYIWGGGHGRWNDLGYDCSGAVSFALHGGRLLASPLPSGTMATWGEAGRGRWITIYANPAHAYAVIAGLRWDTAGDEEGTGPRWHESLAAAASGPFTARHPVGY